MKISLIKAEQALKSLEILRTRHCPIATAFKIATFADALTAQILLFQKELQAKINAAGFNEQLPESATPEEKAQRDADMRAFADDVNATADHELIEVPDIKITLAELGSAETTPEALQGIRFVIVDPEKEFTPVEVTPMERMQ